MNRLLVVLFLLFACLPSFGQALKAGALPNSWASTAPYSTCASPTIALTTFAVEAATHNRGDVGFLHPVEVFDSNDRRVARFIIPAASTMLDEDITTWFTAPVPFSGFDNVMIHKIEAWAYTDQANHENEFLRSFQTTSGASDSLLIYGEAYPSLTDPPMFVPISAVDINTGTPAQSTSLANNGLYKVDMTSLNSLSIGNTSMPSVTQEIIITGSYSKVKTY